MYKPDTILWGKESDNYTQRAKNLFKDNLYSNPKDFRDAEKMYPNHQLIEKEINSIIRKSRRITRKEATPKLWNFFHYVRYLYK